MDNKTKETDKHTCYLCSKEIPKGCIYCERCQKEIDDALCNYDNWPFDR